MHRMCVIHIPYHTYPWKHKCLSKDVIRTPIDPRKRHRTHVCMFSKHNYVRYGTVMTYGPVQYMYRHASIVFWAAILEESTTHV